MRHLLLVVVCLIPLSGIAQYKGGSNDGFSRSATGSQNASPPIYSGGSSDGHALTSGRNQNSSPGIYAGGPNDGFAKTQPKGSVNIAPGIYSGGPDDGIATFRAIAQNAIPGIYAGGPNDGFNMIQPKGSVNTAPGIYSGGPDDGISLYRVSAQNAIPAIYGGGESDGYSFNVSLHQNSFDNDPRHDAQRSLALLNLSGNWFNDDAVLAWKTGEEPALDFFQLQRSDDGGDHFSDIAKVSPDGSSSPQHEYRYTDIGAYSTSADFLVYRLKCVERNGDSRYSSIVKLTKDRTAPIIVAYPNPTSGRFTLSLLNVVAQDLGAYSYILTAADGKLIKQGRVQESSTAFDLSGLASATYHLTLSKNGQRVQHFKIVLTQ